MRKNENKSKRKRSSASSSSRRRSAGIGNGKSRNGQKRNASASRNQQLAQPTQPTPVAEFRTPLRHAGQVLSPPGCEVSSMAVTEPPLILESEPDARRQLKLPFGDIEASADAYFVTDGVGKIVRANSAASALLNVPETRLIGKPITAYVPLLWRRDFRMELTNLAQVPRVEWNSWLFRRDADPTEVRIVAASVKDGSGRVTQIHWAICNNSERQRAQRQLERYEERLRALAAELGQAEERERRRIAHGLHDSVGQMLALLKLQLGALRAAPPGPKSARDLAQMEAVLDEAIHLTRTLTFELAPPMLYELGLTAALQWLVERYDRHGDLEVRLHVPQNGRVNALEPPGPIAALLFTAVRELLHNVLKHAEATTVDVSVGEQEGRLCVAVDDNGRGFPSGGADPPLPGLAAADRRNGEAQEKTLEKSDGFGLFSIRTRLLYVGGEMRIISAAGKGTHITLIAPPADATGPGEGDAT